jgi:ABC-type glycerol-3-phosphate transport system permease component
VVAHSEAVPRRRRRSQRAVARRFDSAGPFTYVFLILVVLVSLFPLYWSLVVA